jgi:hypothetical protein
MSTVSIHQPNFLPWVGFFSKIVKSDIFVILDDVKCSKGSYFNRNRFSTSKEQDWFWLTVPVEKNNFHLNLNEVIVDSRFIKSHKKYFEIDHLKKSKEPDLIRQLLMTYEKYDNNENFKLIDFNIDVIELILRSIDCKTKVIKSSDIKKDNSLKKQDLVIEIVKKLQGSCYLSGGGAAAYQDQKSFLENDILLRYNEFDIRNSYIIKNECMSIFDVFLRDDVCQLKKSLTSL